MAQVQPPPPGQSTAWGSQPLKVPEPSRECNQSNSFSFRESSQELAVKSEQFSLQGSLLSAPKKAESQATIRRRRSADSQEQSSGLAVTRKSPSTRSRQSTGSRTETATKSNNFFSRCLTAVCYKAQPGKSQQTMFADKDEAKADIRENLGKREYDVADFYHKTGIAQAIATNAKFATLTLVIISINSLWIGFEMDTNTEDNLFDAEWYFQAGEFFFCIFFLFEWSCRFFAFRRKCDGFRDKWFCFDAFLVALMLFETIAIPILLSSSKSGNEDEEGGSGVAQFTVLRMLRLLRLTRMVRFMRAMPELVTLIKSMHIAARPVLSTLGLLFIIIYVFAIIFKSQLEPEGKLDHKFGKLTHSMITLLFTGTFLDDIEKVSNMLVEQSPIMTAVFIAFILLSSFTVLNLLIGMLCEVVNVVSQIEKERSMVQWVKSKLFDVLEELDEDGSGMISKEEFNKLLEVPMAVNAMEDLGVDIQNLVALSDHLFQSEGQMTSQRVSRPKEESNEIMDPEILINNDIEPQASVASAQWLTKSHAASCSFLKVEEISEDDEEERELSFGEFIETVISLRSENHPSIMHITEFRKLCIVSQHQTNDFLDDIEDQGDMLVEDLQQLVCNHPFYKLICDHPELRKSPFSPGGHNERRHSFGERCSRAEAADSLRRKLDIAAERRLGEVSTGPPDEVALERAFTMADAVEVMAEGQEKLDVLGLDVLACLDNEALEEPGDRNRSPLQRTPPRSRSGSPSARPDTFALAKALTTAATSLADKQVSPGSSSSSPNRLLAVPRCEPLHLGPSSSQSHDRRSPPRESTPEDLSWLFPGAPLRPPSESPRPSRGEGTPPSTRATSRERGNSPEALREMSREETLLTNASSLGRALTAACCNEEHSETSLVTSLTSPADAVGIRPVRNYEEFGGSPFSDTTSSATLHAVLPGPDEDALQRAFLCADNGPLANNSFLDELGLSLDRESGG